MSGTRNKRFLVLFLKKELLPFLLVASAASAQGLPLGGPAKWKYLTFVPATHTLYVAHGSEVTVIDTARPVIKGRMSGLSGAKGVAVAAGGHVYVTSSKAGTVAVFDSSTMGRLATVPAGADANAIVYDPPTGRVFAMNDDADTITVIDTVTDTPVATIELPGGEGLESAASDGQGHLFVAHSAGQDVLRIDTRRAVLDERFRLSGCPKPQGLALNVAAGRIYVSCESGVLVILDARSGRQVATLPIGPGSETVLFDAARHRIYTPNDDSTLSVIDVDAADGYRVGKPVRTAPGARTAAEDPATGRVYFVGGAGEVMSVVP